MIMGGWGGYRTRMNRNITMFKYTHPPQVVPVEISTTALLEALPEVKSKTKDWT